MGHNPYDQAYHAPTRGRPAGSRRAKHIKCRLRKMDKPSHFKRCIPLQPQLTQLLHFRWRTLLLPILHPSSTVIAVDDSVRSAPVDLHMQTTGVKCTPHLYACPYLPDRGEADESCLINSNGGSQSSVLLNRLV